MPKVYIVQEPLVDRSGVKPPKDLSSLSKYGEIVYLLHRHDRGTDNPNRILSLLESRLDDFVPEEDFILNLGSDPVSSVLIGMVLERFSSSEINFLKWEKKRSEDGSLTRDGFYIPVKLILTP